jgi:proline iminopeptidase
MTTRQLDSLEAFDINGSTQWLLLRGNVRTQRVLLVLQQGPGLPLIQDARVFEQRLQFESEGVVAYWDQRGTGKSCPADPATIHVPALVEDVRAVVDALCARLAVDRVDLLGFSIGGTLATLAAARDPTRIGHVVVVGLDVDWGESERYAYAFASNEAARRGDKRAQAQLEAIGAPPHDSARKFLTRARWVTEYGGIHRKRGFFGLLWDTVWRVLVSPHYSPRESVRALLAIDKTQRLLLAPVNHFDLRATVTRLAVPIAFFQGRHDVGTNPHVVAGYAAALAAPQGKSFVWFEHSAHMPYYEEPVLFREALLRALELTPDPCLTTSPTGSRP